MRTANKTMISKRFMRKRITTLEPHNSGQVGCP